VSENVKEHAARFVRKATAETIVRAIVEDKIPPEAEWAPSFAADPRPERITKVVGSLPRRDGPSPALLVRFDRKPTKSAGGLHLPLSQQVEPEWATCVRAGRTREQIAPGDRLLVKAHFNGDPLPGTDCHWLAEDDVLGVEEA
jgi:co-chaperonin GroES (HSP10)